MVRRLLLFLTLSVLLGAASARAQTIFVRDSFTGTNGTNLTAHNPDIGNTGSWTSVYGGVISIQGNRIQANSTATWSIYLNQTLAPAAAYAVGVDARFTQANANNFVEIYGRADATALNGYIARVDATGNVQLMMVLGGALTTLATGTHAITLNVDHTLNLSITNAAKEVSVDGVLVVTSANNSITAAGRAGVGLQNNTAVTQTSADNFYAGTFSPTAVTLDSATAARDGGNVLVEWRTSKESRTLGYHVYREVGGSRTRIDDVLIGGTLFRSQSNATLQAGNVYRWLDTLPAGATAAKYWIEEIDSGGLHTMHGPIRPVPGRFDPKIGRSPVLRELNQQAVPGSQTATRVIRADAVVASSGKRRGVVPAAADQLQQFALAARDSVKLSVTRDGWYRVTQPELLAAGLPATADPRLLRLFADGRETAIVVNGESDGRFDTGDSLEFYGTALDTPWTGTHAYYLVLDTTAGARVRTPAPPATATPVTAFTQSVERRDRVFFIPSIADDDAFFGALVSSEPVSPVISLPNLAPAGDAALTVSLLGFSDVDDEIEHHVAIAVNGHAAGELSFGRSDRGSITVPLPHAWLREGDNVFTLTAAGGEHDLSVIEAIRVSYPHRAAADDGTLFAQIPAQSTMQLSGLGAGARAIDITNPFDVTFAGTAEGSDDLTVSGAGFGTRTLFAFDDAHVLQPAAIAARTPTQLHAAQAGADLVIVSARPFLPAVEPLRALRASQGLSVAVVDVADVFDEFSFGASTPAALRAFFKRATATWTKAPSYILLVGDSTFDPRDYLGKGVADSIPSKMVMGTELKSVSDAWLTDFDGDGAEDIPTGRLSVRAAAEAATVVAKIVAYDAQPLGQSWQNRVVLVAGDDASLGFSTAAESLVPALPEAVTAERIDLGTVGATAGRQSLLTAFDEGALLVDYVGHGSVEVWTGSSFFNSDDATRMTNGARLPFVVAMTCLNGEFNDIYTTALGEALLNAPAGGAVAVWASSSLNEVDGQKDANATLMQQLFPVDGSSPRLGDAIRATKLAVPDVGVRTTWLLLGDPSMRLRR